MLDPNESDRPSVPGWADGAPEAPRPEEPRRYGRIGPVVAWTVVLLVIVARLVQPGPAGPLGEEEGEEADSDPTGALLLDLQGRYLVGAAEVGGGGAMLLPGAEALDVGPIAHRQRFVILAGELGGPVEARRRLDRLDRLIDQERVRTGEEPLRGIDAQVERILHALYPPVDEDAAAGTGKESAGAGGESAETGAGDEIAETGAGEGPVGGPGEAAAAPEPLTLSEEDRATLETRLGWFGRLALAQQPSADPAAREALLGPALTTFWVLLGAVIGAAGVGVLGFAGLVTLLVLALLGRLRSGMGPSRPHGGVYAETFAIWLVLFFGLQIGAAQLVDHLSAPPTATVLLVFFVSLVVLAWPVWRGIPWRQVREDIGWTWGRNAALEPFIGVGCYAMTLPLLGIGVVATYVLMMLDAALHAGGPPFAPVGAPAHPIVNEVVGGDAVAVLKILLLASVAAPIVEETMFRGVLYRHLRDATAWLRGTASVLLSALVNGFVFAIVHPQGWLAVPALASLAVGFALAREWRGTLVPSMVMHGLSNGLVLCLLVAIMPG